MKKTKLIAGLLVTVLLTLALALPAVAQVEPPVVDEELAPGASMEVTKEVTTPTLLPTADVVISVDLTGSMDGELDNLKIEIGNIITALSGASADLNVGIVSHEDYPDYYESCGYAAWYGNATWGDEPFRVDYAVGSDFDAAKYAVLAMNTKHGEDLPESYARVMWESGHSDNLMGYRDDAQKILVMFLDDLPHDCDVLGDGSRSTGVDPGRDEIAGTGDDIDVQDDAIPSMTGADITLLVVHSGAAAYKGVWDDIAGATGGSAVQINSDGTVPGGISLTELILGLIQEIKTDVWWEVEADPGLTVTLSPLAWLNVSGDTTVEFTETITLAEDAPQCETLTATVTFYANEYPEDGAVIGEQEIYIYVADVTPPTVGCREWVNPHGKVPPAGWTTEPGTNPNSGRNPDGFYQLGVWDTCDPDPMIYVTEWPLSGVVFGPFPHGTVVKITEDPDIAAPVCKKMGSFRGRAGEVDWHIILRTDAAIWGVDADGNASGVLCLVPPPPK